MAASMVSPDNAPRSIEGLKGLSRAVRYRLALNMGIVGSQPESPDTKAFLGSDVQIQAQTLLDALNAKDSGNGMQMQETPAMAPAPPPMQQVHPAPMQPAQMPPMQPMQPMQPGQQEPQVQTQQPAPAATRQPATQADPSNAGAQTGPALSANIMSKMDGIELKINSIAAELEGVPGMGEIEELKDFILGTLRVNRLTLMLLLELAENTLGMDKETIIAMIAAATASGEVEELLTKTYPGKG